jgi:hypothetical protein
MVGTSRHFISKWILLQIKIMLLTYMSSIVLLGEIFSKLCAMAVIQGRCAQRSCMASGWRVSRDGRGDCKQKTNNCQHNHNYFELHIPFRVFILFALERK